MRTWRLHAQAWSRYLKSEIIINTSFCPPIAQDLHEEVTGAAVDIAGLGCDEMLMK